jgi:hypothetical protein
MRKAGDIFLVAPDDRQCILIDMRLYTGLGEEARDMSHGD